MSHTQNDLIRIKIANEIHYEAKAKSQVNKKIEGELNNNLETNQWL